HIRNRYDIPFLKQFLQLSQNLMRYTIMIERRDDAMSIYPIILSQGEFINKEDLTYPFEERGLQFGDGVYEVIRIYQGNMYLQEEHIARLFRSLEAIRIQWDYHIDDIRHMLEQLIEKNNLTNNGHIYMTVSRYSATRVHPFPAIIFLIMYCYVIDHPHH